MNPYCPPSWVALDRSTRIQVSSFHTALQLSGLDIPVAEAECLVANMIYKGYMRGYISHKAQTVVLSHTAAFPRLHDVPAPYSSI